MHFAHAIQQEQIVRPMHNHGGGARPCTHISLHVRRSNQVDNEPITLYYVIQATSPNFPFFPRRGAALHRRRNRVFSSSFYIFSGRERFFFLFYFCSSHSPYLDNQSCDTICNYCAENARSIDENEIHPIAREFFGRKPFLDETKRDELSICNMYHYQNENNSLVGMAKNNTKKIQTRR